MFGLQGRSAEQRLAVDLLTDPGVGIVSLGGRAGTGKSALALCAGLEAVMERREHRKVVVDEAQSLERNVLLTVLSRIGQNSTVVLTHDVAQRDNLRVGRHDGIAALVTDLLEERGG